MKYLQLISSTLTILLLSSCASMLQTEGWVVTDDDVSLWMSDCDTIKNYHWDGGAFANVANGKGTLYTPNDDGSQTGQSVNAFYGAIDKSQIVSLDDGGKYVGAVINDQMSGFGVLSKGGELYIGEFQNSKPNGYLKWYKGEKLYYDGQWKDGAFHGEGTLYKDDGSIKSGTWEDGTLIQTLVDIKLPSGHYKGFAKHGKPDGLGKMLYSNDTYYQGFWKNGQWTGEGLYVNKEDSIYGIWENGKANGDIIYRTKNLLFEGTCVDNAPLGIGNLTMADGTYYSGNWLEGKRSGYGELQFSNGDRYYGEWADNCFDGYGTYNYSQQKAQYQGNWKDGLQDGDGIYRSPEFIYHGEWEKGWMDGEGTLRFKNGDKYEGTVHENLLDGVGCYTYANGNRYEGEFVTGQMTGVGVFQFKNGNRFEGEFQNNRIYGDGTMYLIEKGDTVSITGFWPIDGKFPKEASIMFANGDLYEGPLVNGFPTAAGTWTSGKERQAKIDKIENSTAHKANEFYKKHRETINYCVIGASIALTAIVLVCNPGVGVGVAMKLNNVINAVDASMAIASAAQDVAEGSALGEDTDEAVKTLEKEVAINAVLILAPKVLSKGRKLLGKAVKNVTRSKAAANALKQTGKLIIKKSAIKFIKGKVVGRAVKVSISFQKGVRKVEKALIRNKSTRSAMIATGRILTGMKHQTVKYSSFLNKIKKNPALKEQLKLSAEGNSKNLGENMRLLGTDKWVHKNERIRRYLKMPKRQVEPHHIIPSNPTTEAGRQAREIWTKYFGSVDHPCNGIWLGKSNKKLGYKALAKGSNHGPNSIQYEEYVSNALIQTHKKYQKQFAKHPELMEKVLAETVDNIKEQLYKGNLAIGSGSHQVHTVLSIFKDSKGVVSEAANNLSNAIMRLSVQ